MSIGHKETAEMRQIAPIAFVVMIAVTAPQVSNVLAAAATARVAAGTV